MGKLKTLATTLQKGFKSYDRVQTMEPHGNCKRGEWGKIVKILLEKKGLKGIEVTCEKCGQTDWYQNCKIIAYEKSSESNKDRRRLSPCEKLLHEHRLANPYRDSPVLTRLLSEIREANK